MQSPVCDSPEAPSAAISLCLCACTAACAGCTGDSRIPHKGAKVEKELRAHPCTRFRRPLGWVSELPAPLATPRPCRVHVAQVGAVTGTGASAGTNKVLAPLLWVADLVPSCHSDAGGTCVPRVCRRGYGICFISGTLSDIWFWPLPFHTHTCTHGLPLLLAATQLLGQAGSAGQATTGQGGQTPPQRQAGMQSPVEARNRVRQGWHTALPEAAWFPPLAMQRPWFLSCRGSQGAGHDIATVCAGSSFQQSYAQLLGPTSLQHFVLPPVVTSSGFQCCCLWHPYSHGTHSQLLGLLPIFTPHLTAMGSAPQEQWGPRGHLEVA